MIHVSLNLSQLQAGCRILLGGVALVAFCCLTNRAEILHAGPIEDPLPAATIPKELIHEMSEALARYNVNVEVSIDAEIATEVRYSVSCTTFRVYDFLKSVELPDSSRSRLGPRDRGFQLTLQCDVPPSAGSTAGAMTQSRLIARQYWTEYTNFWKLKPDGGYLRLSWQEGAGVDPDVMKQVKDVLSKFGIEVFADPDMGEIWASQSEKLHNRLLPMLAAIPDAKWHRDKDALECDYGMREYDVHSVSVEGVVTPTAEKLFGPKATGFAIRFRPVKVVGKGQAQMKSGWVREGYWMKYVATFENAECPFILEMRYGPEVDKEWLASIVAAVEEIFPSDHGF